MGRPRKPDDEKKVNLTVRIKQKLVNEIKSYENYNKKVEQVLEEHFDKKQ